MGPVVIYKHRRVKTPRRRRTRVLRLLYVMFCKSSRRLIHGKTVAFGSSFTQLILDISKITSRPREFDRRDFPSRRWCGTRSAG